MTILLPLCKFLFPLFCPNIDVECTDSVSTLFVQQKNTYILTSLLEQRLLYGCIFEGKMCGHQLPVIVIVEMVTIIQY
jgi:hypothetical protein